MGVVNMFQMSGDAMQIFAIESSEWHRNFYGQAWRLLTGARIVRTALGFIKKMLIHGLVASKLAQYNRASMYTQTRCSTTKKKQGR